MARRTSRPPTLSAVDLAARLESGSLPSVVVLAGAERWFREEGLRLVVRRVLPDGDSGASLLRLDARRPEDRSGVSGAVDELRSATLFGGAKVIAVENADQAAGPWAEGRKSPIRNLTEAGLAADTSSVLVLLTARPVRGKSPIPAAALVEAGALVVDCRSLYDAPGSWQRGVPPYEHELSRWIVRRLAGEHGKQMDLADAHAVSRLVGSELGELDAALKSLALFAGSRQTVVEQDVHEALGATRTDPAWRLTDAVAQRDLDGALTLLEAAFDRGVPDGRGGQVTNPEPLFHFLAASLLGTWRRLLAGAEALSRGETPADVAKGLGVPSFRAEGFLAQCRRDPADLLARQAAFFEAETGVKGGGVPARLALLRLVVTLAA